MPVAYHSTLHSSGPNNSMTVDSPAMDTDNDSSASPSSPWFEALTSEQQERFQRLQSLLNWPTDTVHDLSGNPAQPRTDPGPCITRNAASSASSQDTRNHMLSSSLLLHCAWLELFVCVCVCVLVSDCGLKL